MRDSLPRGSRERLLLSCYSRILPVRCDLNRVAVLMCPASAADLTEEQERSVTESNFVCLPSDKSKLAVLVLREFKTAGSQRVWQHTLPGSLTQEIWQSLHAEPCKWLSTTKAGQPYTTKNYSRWCCTVLQELFGRRLTLMRHSYLTAIDWNRLTISDKKQLAAAMCHSTETQQTYRQQPPHPVQSASPGRWFGPSAGTLRPASPSVRPARLTGQSDRLLKPGVQGGLAGATYVCTRPT